MNLCLSACDRVVVNNAHYRNWPVPRVVTFLKQTEQGCTLTDLGSGAHHRLGLTAEVVGHKRVRWSAARLSNESALPRTTDSTP